MQTGVSFDRLETCMGGSHLSASYFLSLSVCDIAIPILRIYFHIPEANMRILSSLTCPQNCRQEKKMVFLKPELFYLYFCYAIIG